MESVGVCRFCTGGRALLVWECRYNHGRFSMALNGLTQAEKLATFMTPSLLRQGQSPEFGSHFDGLPWTRHPSRVLSLRCDAYPVTTTTSSRSHILTSHCNPEVGEDSGLLPWGEYPISSPADLSIPNTLQGRSGGSFHRIDNLRALNPPSGEGFPAS